MGTEAENDVNDETIINAEIVKDEELEIDQGLEGADKNLNPEDSDNEEAEIKDEESDDDEIVVSIEGESPPQDDEEETKAPEWVRELRKKQRETQKENRELKEKLESLSGAAEKPAELGDKPTLEGCDYDSAEYESQLADWYDKKREHDEAAEATKADEQQQQQAWQKKLDDYGTAKTELKVKDFDDAEGVVLDNLSSTQQGMILQGADNSALVMYAIGKNPQRAKELGSIKDPVKFAFAVAKLETQLKVSGRKKAPQPEGKVSGTGSLAGSVDSTLERLRADAEKSGDYTKVREYKKQKRAAN